MGGQRHPLNIRDETRDAAAQLMPQIIRRIQQAIDTGEIDAVVGDEIIGMVKNNVYLIELSYMQAADDGGGEREADQPPEALRLSLVGGR